MAQSNSPASYRVRQGFLLLLAVVLGLFGAKDLFLLTRYDVPSGVDGYYYLVQVRSFLDSGTFYYATNTPVVLYLLSFAAKVSGNALLSVKVTSIFLHSILVGSVCALVYSFTKSKPLALLSTVVSLLSVVHLILVAEFIKQLGGISLALLAVVCIIKPEGRRVWRPVGIALLAISLFAHKSIILLFLGAAFLALIFFAIDRVSHSRLSRLRMVGIVLGIILVGLCLPLLLSRQSILFQPQISEAVVLTPRFQVTHAGFEERLVLLFLAPATLFLCVKKLSTELSAWPRYVIGVAALSALLVTLNPFLVHQEQLKTVSERLDLFAYLQISVLLPAFIWLSSAPTLRIVVLLSVVCLLALGNATLPAGLQPGFLERRQTLYNVLSSARPKIGAQSVIIAPHGDDFIVTFATGAPSRSSILTAHPGNNLYWLLIGAPCRATENVTIVSLPEGCMVLVREGFPVALTDVEKRRIIALNPHLKKMPSEVIDKVLSLTTPKNFE